MTEYFAFLDTGVIVRIPNNPQTFSEADHNSPPNTHWIFEKPELQAMIQSAQEVLHNEP